MIKQKRGFIINIVSGAGRTGMKNLSIYCASKFGLIGLSESIRKELKNSGIEVLHFCPGYVKTDFFRDFPPEFCIPSYAVDPEVVAKKVLKKITKRHRLEQLYDVVNLISRVGYRQFDFLRKLWF